MNRFIVSAWENELIVRIKMFVLKPFEAPGKLVSSGGYLSEPQSRVMTGIRYTGCAGRNVPDFGRMFLTLKYTDITQNTYIRS